MSRRIRKPKSKRIFLAILGLSFVTLTTVLIGPRLTELILGPPDFSGPGNGNVQIEILQGDSIAKIGNTLKSAGVVKSVDAFTLAASNNPDSGKISPGFYSMLLEMKAKDAILRLLDPTSKVVTKVTIPEGKRASDIFELISNETSIPISDFEAIAADPAQLPLPEYANGNLEGFLFPATYEFPPGTTALTALTSMVEKYNSVVKQLDLEASSASIGMSTYEILTIASLLEVEGHPNDFAKVSRVVYNRLNLPMKLEFDSTVNYGLGRKDVLISGDLLAQDNPYNTYKNFGLPPTPIGNPGIAAIDAALNPDQGDWIFFVTTNLTTQETKFTSSYSQFLIWKDEFLAYCKQNPDTCYK